MALALVATGTAGFAGSPAKAADPPATSCSNEPFPNDVGFYESNTGALFVGADTGLGNVPVTAGVCVVALGGAATVLVLGTSPTPGRVGIKESVHACLATACGGPLVDDTGADVGAPVITNGPTNLACVATTCVKSAKVTVPNAVFVDGTETSLPLCVAGPGQSCP